MIARYREMWQISVDSSDPLGDPPMGPAQHTDRAALERRLDRTARLLARIGHGRDTLNARRSAGARVQRGLGVWRP